MAGVAAQCAVGEVDTSSPFQSVRQAVDLFGGGAAAVSQWRHPPPVVHLRPEVSQPEPAAPPRVVPFLLAALFLFIMQPRGTAVAFRFFKAQRRRVAAACLPSRCFLSQYLFSKKLRIS